MQASIVIPVYNERHRLPDNLIATIECLHELFEKSEIIIVEDGSTETMEDYLKSLHPVSGVEIRYLAHPLNKGKGCSVKKGILAAEGEMIGYIDADGSTPIHEIKKLIRAVSDGADIAFGSRAISSGQTIVEKTVHRYLLGTIFTMIVKHYTGLAVHDTQCGFKLFRKEAAKKLFSELVTEGFAFDVEILARARKEGYRLREIPVHWYDVSGSKVRLFTDSIRMLQDVKRISDLIKR
jgi:dolichyl-phosphate beta-glucosyltransferase